MNVLLKIWQLPQFFAGAILDVIVTVFKLKTEQSVVKNSKENVKVVFVKKFFKSAVSLGTYVFADNLYFHAVQIVKAKMIGHELGHSKQSKYLGPLYLFVIGLPSLIGNLLYRMKVIKNYYKQPWEAWADKLGGVER